MFLILPCMFTEVKKWSVDCELENNRTISIICSLRHRAFKTEKKSISIFLIARYLIWICHYEIKSLLENFLFLLMLNDKNTPIFNLKYRKGFLILVSGKGMEILYYFKPFLQGIIKRQVDYFLFLLEALS